MELGINWIKALLIGVELPLTGLTYLTGNSDEGTSRRVTTT